MIPPRNCRVPRFYRPIIWPDSGRRVINQRADWLADILGPLGWEFHHESGEPLCDPSGKGQREGHSYTIGAQHGRAERQPNPLWRARIAADNVTCRL